MQAKKANRALNVTDPKAIAWLTGEKRIGLLTPFFARAITVSEAADKLELSANQAYKLVKRLEKLGLLRLESTEARRGRALRYYRTAADEFFIPPSAASFEAVFLKMSKRPEEALAHNIALSLEQDQERPGWRIFLSGPGKVSTVAARVPGETLEPLKGSSPAMSMWHRMSLDYEDARELQEELEALVSKYYARPGQQAYILRLALAPGSY